MRYAFLADVHSNLEALAAVLAHLGGWPGARLVCAGDLVGYGPDPDACIALLASREAVCVAGNHEGMVLGRIGFDRCVHAGIRAALWTRGVLTPASRDYLAGLPARLDLLEGVVVTHAMLGDPERYVASAARADRLLDEVLRTAPGARLVVTGHTHHARLYRRGGRWETPPFDVDLPLAPDEPFVLNPGSVGQSRDGRPLARFAVYDSGRGVVRFFELPYDHRRTEAKLRRAGLVPRVSYVPPTGLARRVDGWRTRWARHRARAAGDVAGRPMV